MGQRRGGSGQEALLRGSQSKGWRRRSTGTEFAAKRIGKEELDALREVVESSSRFEEEERLEEFPQLNRRFHELVAGAVTSVCEGEYTSRLVNRRAAVLPPGGQDDRCLPV